MHGALSPDNLDVVSRRIFQFVAGVVLILAALTPLTECFDRWDKNPSPASDTEIHLTAWFAGVGIVLTLAKVLQHVPLLASVRRCAKQVLPAGQALRLSNGDRLEPTGSPPLIPLRI